MENTIFESKYNITGRGLVYIVDIRKIPGFEVKLGDEIMFEDQIRTVTGIEKSGDGFWTDPVIGILVRDNINKKIEGE